MMPKILVLLFLCSLVVSSKAEEKCFLKTSAKIYYAGDKNSVPLESFVLATDCNIDVQKKFREIVFNTTGAIYADYVRTALKEDLGNTLVELTPSKIEIIPIVEKLNEKITEDQVWTNVRIGTGNTLLLSADDTLSLNCNSCGSSGPKSIEATITNPVTSKNQKEWIQADLGIKTTVLVAKNHITVNNLPLNPADFDQQKQTSPHPERYFSDQMLLGYYKLNKPITKGTPIQVSDLVAINLVTAGQPVKIVLQDNDLSLSTSGLPMSSGKYGDTIQVKRIVNQKIVVGKVIDFNKVTIVP